MKACFGLFGRGRCARFAAALVLGILAVSSLSMADTHAWVGASGGNWATAGNWNPGQVPEVADSATLTGGSWPWYINYNSQNDMPLNVLSVQAPAYLVQTDGEISANSLTIDNGAFLQNAPLRSNVFETIYISGTGLWTNYELRQGNLTCDYDETIDSGWFLQSGTTTTHIISGDLYAMNGGDYEICGGTLLPAQSVFIGNAYSPGYFWQTGGWHDIGFDLNLAMGPYTLTASGTSGATFGALTAYVGMTPEGGTFDQNGGTAAPTALYVGYGGDACGTYKLRNGWLTPVALDVGTGLVASGTAEFIHTDGLNTVANTLTVGTSYAGAVASYTMQLSGTKYPQLKADTIVVSGTTNGGLPTSTFAQQTGLVDVKDLAIGVNSGYGKYTLSGGRLIARRLFVGDASSRGVLDLTSTGTTKSITIKGIRGDYGVLHLSANSFVLASTTQMTTVHMQYADFENRKPWNANPEVTDLAGLAGMKLIYDGGLRPSGSNDNFEARAPNDGFISYSNGAWTEASDNRNHFIIGEIDIGASGGGGWTTARIDFTLTGTTQAVYVNTLKVISATLIADANGNPGNIYYMNAGNQWDPAPRRLKFGDANLSGFVNNNDLSILLAHWNQAGGWPEADFTGDQYVDNNDLSVLLAHWDNGSPAAIPEPATLGLIAVGALAACLRRRRG